MNTWLNHLYQKSELQFALVWIGLYCLANSLAFPLSEAIGVGYSAALVVNGILTVALYRWIKSNLLMEHYGLCRSSIPASRFLWYIPLILFMSHNLWFGVAVKLPAADTACYILSMVFVGFLEEVIFRGFLFRALAKDNVTTAIVISSVTFGLGHMMNLFNGRGMELAENVCQVVGAIACGFLFVIIFYRGGSLIPCIVAHSVNNAVSVFSNGDAYPVETQLLLMAVNMAILVVSAIILCRTLRKEK